MGNIIKTCHSTEREESRQKLKMENELLRREIKMNAKILDDVKTSYTDMKSHVNRICDVFEDLDVLSTEIMTTDLHKEWMDDDVEKKYLVDVLTFLAQKLEYVPEL